VPFDAESVITIIQHHYFTPVPDIQAVRDGVPEELLAVVYRALTKDAGQRYASTRDMVKALEAVPFSPEDKAQSEELLRNLARGEAIPKIRTGSLPPLADARTIGAGALGPLSPTIAGAPTATAPSARKPPPQPRQPSRAPLVALVSVGLIGLGVALWWFMLRGGGTASVAPDTLTPPSGTQLASGGTTTPTAAPPAAPAQQAAAAAPTTDTARTVRPSTEQPAAPTARPATRRPTETKVPAAPVVEPAGTGLLRLRTVPPNALILVDGRRVGEQGSAFDVEIPAGRRRIRITAPGYVTFDTTITVEPGSTVNLGQKTLRSEGGP
jgi:hypothetical protein